MNIQWSAFEWQNFELSSEDTIGYFCWIATEEAGENMRILDWIFPPRCPLCGELLMSKDEKVHFLCYQKLNWVHEPKCKRCGKPLTTANREINMFCQDCLKTRHRHAEMYDQGRALWIYEDVAKASVMDFKYHGMKSYVDFYADALVRTQGEWIRRKNPDILIPIPLHRRKKRMRGFNQTELLARAISDRTGIPMRNDILYRRKWTNPQKSVSGLDRRQNLAKSMEIRQLPEGIKCAMLIDDIYTTGSTMEACARILKQNGVKEVYFLTLCIGLGIG